MSGCACEASKPSMRSAACATTEINEFEFKQKKRKGSARGWLLLCPLKVWCDLHTHGYCKATLAALTGIVLILVLLVLLKFEAAPLGPHPMNRQLQPFSHAADGACARTPARNGGFGRTSGSSSESVSISDNAFGAVNSPLCIDARSDASSPSSPTPFHPSRVAVLPIRRVLQG